MKLGMFLLMFATSLSVLAVAQERKGTARDAQAQDSARNRGPRVQDPKSAKDRAARREAIRMRQPRTSPERERVADPGEPSGSIQPAQQQPRPVVRDEHRKMFDTVRSGLVSGRIGSISEMMGPQVYVNLRGGESGYFSANQAHYVLENYLRSRKVSSLEFSTVGETEATPYASGSVGLHHKGSRENAQVYVSLAEVGGKWVISQIKIY